MPILSATCVIVRTARVIRVSSIVAGTDICSELWGKEKGLESARRGCGHSDQEVYVALCGPDVGSELAFTC